MIKEIIIVEGKDDITKVKQAIDCEVIATNGIHISKHKLKEIISITKDRGAIILTDPDHAGGKIRNTLRKNLVCEIKEAFIIRDKCNLKGNIGVENASAKDIKEAILKAKPVINETKAIYDSSFMFRNRLNGSPDSKRRRDFISNRLNMGKPNAKEFLRRLNAFQIPKNEVNKIIEELDNGKNISS